MKKRMLISARLDKGLEEARVRGWTVVSMKNDWKLIFVFENDHVK